MSYADPLLSMRHVGVTRGKATVLENVSLSLTPGTLTAVIGPNGSGKTTLLRAAMRMIPSSGEIDWQGLSISRYRRNELAQVVAYLPQGANWLGGQSVMQTLRSGRSVHGRAFGFESALDLRVVLDVARQLKLEELLDRPMEKLSGGQQQRVLVGRALAQQPRALLLDEPATFLDLKFQIEVYSMLQRLCVEGGIGVLMASHDLNLTAEFAHHIVLLRDGKVVAQGEPSQVIRAPILESVFGVKMTEFRDGRGRYVVAPVMS